MKRKQIKIYISVISILIAVCIGLLCSYAPLVAFAANEQQTYSNVLDDLSKDSSFAAENYTVVLDDYSIKVIQIAESEDKELFVYAYQPSGKNKDFRASSINISTTINDDISYKNYKLKYLNSDGVFYKYLVSDFTVRQDNVRYYSITSIYRPFDANIDTQAEYGNEVTEVPFAVNKQYALGEINGKPYASCVDIETIVVTDKFVGFVRYPDGFKLYVGACDSHFVAFNTDKPIDKLLEADVYYTKQSYSYSFAMGVGKHEDFGDKSDEYAYLKYTDKVEHSGGGLFAGTYTWDRIETVEQFISENDLTQNVYSGAIIDVNVANKITDEGKAALQDKKWILRFSETSYELGGSVGSSWSFSTIVGEVTILRLKFETDGITYNLGVIDNKQSGSGDPINDTEITAELNKRGKWILTLLALLLLIILLAPVLPYILKAITWVISLPFKAISSLVKRKDKSVNKKKRGKK